MSDKGTIIQRGDMWKIKNYCCVMMKEALVTKNPNMTRLSTGYQGRVCHSPRQGYSVTFKFCPWCGKEIITEDDPQEQPEPQRPPRNRRCVINPIIKPSGKPLDEWRYAGLRALAPGTPFVVDENGVLWAYLASENRMCVIEDDGTPTEGGVYCASFESGIEAMEAEGYL
jgi:hypothetical protein